MTSKPCGVRIPIVQVRRWASIRATGSGRYSRPVAISRIRVTVSALRRSGVLNANETAALDTPAARATSAIVLRRVACSTNTSTGRDPAPDQMRRGTAGMYDPSETGKTV
jgi:hypothetical protein